MRVLILAWALSSVTLSGATHAEPAKSIENLILYASAGVPVSLLESADAILEARVVSIGAESSWWSTFHDWISIVTGHRTDPLKQSIKVDEVIAYRGKMSPSLTLRQQMPDPPSYRPGHLTPGHRYVFFCRGAPEAHDILWSADLANWPDIPQY